MLYVRHTCVGRACWGQPGGVYKNDGLQAGKLRPRGYKDLLHTSQSGSFLVTEPGLELRIRLGQSSVLVLRPDQRPLLSCCESLVPNPSSRMCTRVRALCPLAARNSSILYLQLLKASMASDGSDVSSTNTPAPCPLCLQRWRHFLSGSGFEFSATILSGQSEWEF